MTQDEIIKMAWDSGAYTHRLTMWGFSLEDLERFAKLIAAKRTWVGLTADEYAELAEEYGAFPINQIEAKLKEKNT